MTLEDAIQLVEDGWPQRFSVAQATIYLEALSDLDVDDLTNAIMRLIRSDEFRPSVARIRYEVEAANAPTAQEALRQAEEVFRYRNALRYVNGSGFTVQRPEVDHRVLAVIEQTPRTFGWREKFVGLWRQQAWRTSE